MPLKYFPPTPQRPNGRIRGTYLGVYIDRSPGSGKRAIALQELKKIESEIERGRFSKQGGLTFAGAAASYMKSGGERRFMTPLIEHFGTTEIDSIDQDAMTDCAAALHPPGISSEPSALNATINRQVFTPVSAVLKSVGRETRFRRPKMPKGRPNWITPEEAEKWVKDCAPKLKRLSLFLLYTGCRLGEALALESRHVVIKKSMAYIPDTKTGESRAAHMPKPLADEMKDFQGFGYRDRWEVYDDWSPRRKELKFPDWWTPHVCRHTWATWMRQYAGMDLRGLIGTGAWGDLGSVMRYQHVVTSNESRTADLLPDVRGQNPGSKNRKRGKSVA